MEHWFSVFGLSTNPFNNAAGLCFDAARFVAVRRRILAAIGEGRGRIVLLTGPSGSGKTTLLRVVAEELRRADPAALVIRYEADPEEGGGLRRAVADLRGLAAKRNRLEADHPAVLLIDDLDRAAEPEVRRFLTTLGAQRAGMRRLRIVLAGRPGYEAAIEAGLDAERGMATERCHLDPLGPAEVASYIQHRVAAGGATRPLFTTEAVERIARHSGGVPRRINLICSNALFFAALLSREAVGADVVDMVAMDAPAVAPPMAASEAARPATPMRSDPPAPTPAESGAAARQRSRGARPASQGYAAPPTPPSPSLAPRREWRWALAEWQAGKGAKASLAVVAIAILGGAALLWQPVVDRLGIAERLGDHDVVPPARPVATIESSVPPKPPADGPAPGNEAATRPAPADPPAIPAIAEAIEAPPSPAVEMPATGEQRAPRLPVAGRPRVEAPVARSATPPAAIHDESPKPQPAAQRPPEPARPAPGQQLEAVAAPRESVAAPIAVEPPVIAEAPVVEEVAPPVPPSWPVEESDPTTAEIPPSWSVDEAHPPVATGEIEEPAAPDSPADTQLAMVAPAIPPEWGEAGTPLRLSDLRLPRTAEDAPPLRAVPLTEDVLGDVNSLRAAIASGVDANQPLPDGRLPLFAAVEANNTPAVAMLLANGARPNIFNGVQGTPMMYAAWNGSGASVDQLLRWGGDPDLASVDGKTALMAAAMKSHLGIMQSLLRHGAAINATTRNGWTALMYAAWAGNTQAVRLILDYGADASARNAEGRTAADLAGDRGFQQLGELLTGQPPRRR